jgi:hypothetical protein
VQYCLRALSQPAVQSVRVSVPDKQHDLKEHHAGCPHRGTAAEPRQYLLSDDWLHQEKQARACENRDREKENTVNPKNIANLEQKQACFFTIHLL